jgi:hypothetical protein
MAAQVRTALKTKVYILWYIAPRSTVYYQRFEDTYCSHFRGRNKDRARKFGTYVDAETPLYLLHNLSLFFIVAPMLEHKASVKYFLSLQFVNPKTVGASQ